MTLSRRLLTFAITVVAIGCGVTEPSATMQPGLLGGPEDTIVDGLAGVAEAGAPMTIVIWTHGDGCRSKGEVETVLSRRRVVVRPFDYVWIGQGLCTDVLRFFRHEVTVSFSEPGDWELKVIGQHSDGRAHEVTFDVAVD